MKGRYDLSSPYNVPAITARAAAMIHVTCTTRSGLMPDNSARSSLSENPDAIWLTMIGSEGIFPFVNGICEKFLGYYRAEIVREIASDRAMEADRFEEVAPLN